MTTLSLRSVEGVYWSLITLILALAVITALYIVGVVLGYLPDPIRLFAVVSVAGARPGWTDSLARTML